MDIEKKPKWPIGTAIDKGKQSVALLETYKEQLQPRLQPDEAEQHKANVGVLEDHRAAQSERLVDQKSKTLGQDEVVGELHASIISVRNIVKSVNPSPEVAKAYGVGEKINHTVSGIVAASNMVISAYRDHTEWSNSIGIIEDDIAEISGLQQNLSQADQVQELSKFERKSGTMDKNTLQRTVEDEVTKLSALGIRIFQKSDPAIAGLFADLIPSQN